MVSLRPYSVQFTLAGVLLEVPAMSAVEWLEVLNASDFTPWDIVPSLLDDEGKDAVTDALIAGSLDLEQVERAGLEVLAAAGGRPWWVTARLVGTVMANWQTIGAEMLMRGVDAERLSIAGWLDVSLLLIMRNIDPKEATMFSLKLEQVPPSEVANQPEQEISAAQFMSMA